MDKKKYKHVETGDVYELTEKEYYLFPFNVKLVEMVEVVEPKKDKKVK